MEIELLDGRVRLIQANALHIPLEDGSVNCCVTSPPYWGLRDYQGAEDQLGLEKTPEQYVEHMVEVFREVKRVLADDGNLFLNIGDSYTGSGKGGNPNPSKQTTNVGSLGFSSLYGKPTTQQEAAVTNVTRNYDGLPPKNLVGIPWRVAFALQADGWILRNDIVWAKPNPMPESVKDRCTRSHEYIFHMVKKPRYWYDAAAIMEPSVSGDLRKPYAPGQIDIRGNGHDRGGGKLRKTDKQGDLDKRTYNGFNDRWDEKERIIRKGLSREEDSPNITGNRVGRDDGGRPCNKPGQVLRNKRDVWFVSPMPYKEAHFATFPPKLIEPCVLAGCPVNGLVLDPFGGSGTTARVAIDHGRRAVLLDINYKDEPGSYLEMAKNRILAPAKPEKKRKKEIPPPEINLSNWQQLSLSC